MDLTPDASGEHRGDPAFAIAPNGTRAAIVERLPSPDRMQDGALRVFELEARTSRLLGRLERRSFERPLFSPSGRVLVARRTERSKEHHGKTELVQLDAGSGQVREVLSSWDRWPVPHGFVDEQRLLVTADDEGAHPISPTAASSASPHARLAARTTPSRGTARRSPACATRSFIRPSPSR